MPHSDGGHEGHTDLGEALKLRRLLWLLPVWSVQAGPGTHALDHPPLAPKARGPPRLRPPPAGASPPQSPRAPEPGVGGGAQGTLVQCTPWKRQLKTPLKAEVTLPLLRRALQTTHTMVTSSQGGRTPPVTICLTLLIKITTRSRAKVPQFLRGRKEDPQFEGKVFIT